jgi:hypothetical protein
MPMGTLFLPTVPGLSLSAPYTLQRQRYFVTVFFVWRRIFP